MGEKLYILKRNVSYSSLKKKYPHPILWVSPFASIEIWI